MQGRTWIKSTLITASLAACVSTPAFAQSIGANGTGAQMPRSAERKANTAPKIARANTDDGLGPKFTDLDRSSKRLRGLVMPLHHATISSRLAATLLRIGPNNGERFKKGDVLVQFDCAVFDAELARSKAQAEAAADTYRVKETLAKSGSVSRLQAVLAKSEVKRAKAEVLVASEKVSQCQIKAPFSGRVVRRIANAHETANFRDPLIEIVSDRDVEVRIFVPSRWLRTLKRGDKFSFLVDETGKSVTAQIVAIGAWIDNVSQLLEIRAKVVRPDFELVAGMSGRAEFPDVK